MNSRAPFNIGIAGPSCAGKTSLARRLTELLPGSTTIFGLDSYYHDLSHLPFSERKKFNFDNPEALEDAMLAAHLQQLACGEPIQRPVYDFPTHTRAGDKFEEVQAGDFLIVEGLFTFYWPQVRGIFDLRVFVHAPDRVCFDRRKVRDIEERGRTMDFVLAQYNETVRPGSESFILPTQQFAHLVISGEQPIEESARQIYGLVEAKQSAGVNRQGR
ncbi:MAG: uridine kinase [Candidatus Angelobacter sp. Gp1-AA117]|nr:MAG: uridine kinase [Candidatus Angelobacter sp. Gp1-AA117]